MFPEFGGRSRRLKRAAGRRPLRIEALEDRRLMTVSGTTASTGANPGYDPPPLSDDPNGWADTGGYVGGTDEEPLAPDGNGYEDPGNQDWRGLKTQAAIDVDYGDFVEPDPFDQPIEKYNKIGALPGLPVLDSNPGATHTLYLNFTGSRLDESFPHPELGDANMQNYRAVFDLDFEPRRFSDAEADAIYRIWRYVADDYAPFNVNVTTYNNAKHPGRGGDQTVEVAIGGWAPQTDAFGVSPQGGFYNTSTERTVFVFSDRVKDKAVAEYDDPAAAYEFFVKGVADAASHESGHLYGLDHQSQRLSNGDWEDYRPAWVDEHGERSAIMGRPFKLDGAEETRSLWTLGVNGNKKVQDDLASLAHRFDMPQRINTGYRPDDVPDSEYRGLGGWDGGAYHVSGTIGVNGASPATPDEDWYGFFNPGGPMQFRVASPAGPFGNLHIKMELYRAHATPGGLGFDELVHVSTVEGPVNSFGALHYPEGHYLLLVTSTGGYGNLGHYELDVLAPGTPGIGVPPMPGEIVDVSGMSFVPELGWAYEPQLAGYAALAPRGFVPIIGEATTDSDPEAPLPTSDFDRDGLVGGGDFLAWQANFGALDATPERGDATGDGVVDADDLANWSSAFGSAAYVVTASDDEPTDGTDDFVPPLEEDGGTYNDADEGVDDYAPIEATGDAESDGDDAGDQFVFNEVSGGPAESDADSEPDYSLAFEDGAFGLEALDELFGQLA